MSVKFGTCSWNYDSWVGLIYAAPEKTAAAYLKQYTEKYRTVEIDSWFYKIPDRNEAELYKSMVDSDFRFTCKVTNSITRIGPDFLSPELFKQYIDSIYPLLDQLDGIMLEFEYLNKTKMSGVDEFVNRTADFLMKIPSGLPVAIETRNKNYLTHLYFEMLQAFGIMHVFSEKLYMPPVFTVFARFQDYIRNGTIIRLLGGDREEIETAAGKKWDRIIMPKDDLRQVIGMINFMNKNGLKITVNVNNHYEGSAPKTIERIEEALL